MEKTIYCGGKKKKNNKKDTLIRCSAAADAAGSKAKLASLILTVTKWLYRTLV